jgi:hypothetical protein
MLAIDEEFGPVDAPRTKPYLLTEDYFVTGYLLEFAWFLFPWGEFGALVMAPLLC